MWKVSGRVATNVNWKDWSCSIFHARRTKGEQMRDFRRTSNPRTFVDLSRETARIEGRHLVRWWVFKCDKLAGLRSDCFVGGETLRVRLVYRDHLNLKTLLLSVQVISSME